MKKEFKMKNNHSGFTLVELLASMALLGLIVVMVFVIFSQSSKVWSKAGARVDQYIAARTVLEQIAREIRNAELVVNFAGPDATSTQKTMNFIVLHAGTNADWVINGWRTPASGDSREQPCSDQIYFVSPVETGSQARQDYAIIGYWVQDPKKDTSGNYNSNKRRYENIQGHSDDVLRRFFVTDNSTNNPTWINMDFTDPKGVGNSDEFALNVKSLSIRCWSDYPDNAHFTEQWEDENGSPADESKSSWNTQNASGTYDGGRLPKAVRITITVQDENMTEKEREFSTVVYLNKAMK